MQLITDNAMVISAGTFGAATIFAAAKWSSQGYAPNYKRVATAAAIGAAAGFLGSVAAVQAKNWSSQSGGANWALLGASTAGAVSIVLHMYKKKATNQLISNTVLLMSAGSLGGAAVTYAKQVR